jgi:hypothetical protein
MPGTGPDLSLDVITIFPGIFDSPLRESLLGKARANGVNTAYGRLEPVRSIPGGIWTLVCPSPTIASSAIRRTTTAVLSSWGITESSRATSRSNVSRDTKWNRLA